MRTPSGIVSDPTAPGMTFPLAQYDIIRHIPMKIIASLYCKPERYIHIQLEFYLKYSYTVSIYSAALALL